MFRSAEELFGIFEVNPMSSLSNSVEVLSFAHLRIESAVLFYLLVIDEVRFGTVYYLNRLPPFVLSKLKI